MKRIKCLKQDDWDMYLGEVYREPLRAGLLPMDLAPFHWTEPQLALIWKRHRQSWRNTHSFAG
jgi:hypothetical protein